MRMNKEKHEHKTHKKKLKNKNEDYCRTGANVFQGMKKEFENRKQP